MTGEPVAGLVFHVTEPSLHSPTISETIILPSPEPPSHNIKFNHACSMIALLGTAAERSNCISAFRCSVRERSHTYSVSSYPRLVSLEELSIVASATAVMVTAIGVVSASAGTISGSIMVTTIVRANKPCFNREQLTVSAF
jgi:hypothetical protein